MAEKKLTEEHLALLAEAEELGINTIGMNLPSSRLDTLRNAIARRTEEIATAAVSKSRMESMEIAPEFDEDEDFSGFDEAAGATRGVLIRLVEFTEWVPVTLDDNIKKLTLANGFTGFEAGEHEKVVSIDTVDTNQRKRVPLDDDPTQSVEYSLHVIKVVLANNVSTDLLNQMIELQGGREEGIRPTGQIIIPDAPMPNRAARRRKN